MIDLIKKGILNNQDSLPFSLLGNEDIVISKFCQRITHDYTKVLFLISASNVPLGVVKIVRSPFYNYRLERERKNQERALSLQIFNVPKIFFDFYSGAYYCYMEEYIDGVKLPEKDAQYREEDIVMKIKKFPRVGIVSLDTIMSALEHSSIKDDEIFNRFRGILLANGEDLVQGFTHGDFGRPNLFVSKGDLYVIDWERSGQYPLWLIDAMYFMMRLRKIRTIEDWRNRASNDFSLYTGVSLLYAESLYCILRILERLRKQDTNYTKIVNTIFDRS